MPLYMDIHKSVSGLTAEALEEAHKKDLQVQDKHGVQHKNRAYNPKITK